ncbi:MAG TPA: OFA family MFS transporter [Peptococcaceae bacterium]|nr:OFA family MFS transporter [Peptococcaceae bacterium]
MGNIRNKAWVVLVAATLFNFLAGLLYIWSIISKAMMTEFHWTASQASLPYTVATVTFVFSMVLFGRLQDIKGPRLCATISGSLMGSGLILSSLTQDPLVMIITFGIITGAGIGISGVVTIPPSVKWFSPQKKGLISGVVLGAVAVSSVFFSPLTNYLLNRFGISKTFLIIGIGVGVIMVILAQFLNNPPANYRPDSLRQQMENGNTPNNPIKTQDIDLNWRDLLKSLGFYKLWLMFAFSSTTGLMIFGHAANIAKFQVGWEGGYLLVIFLALFNCVGRLSGGIISDKIGRFNVMRIIFAVQAVNILLFCVYHSVLLLIVGVGIAGICFGAAFPVFSATVADLYGMKNYGANYGLMFTAWGAGGIIGPMTAASIFDATSSYNNAYIVASVLLVIALAIAFTFKRSVLHQNNS